MLLLMYKSLNDIAPPYLSYMTIACELSRALRSAQQCITLGERTFLISAPAEWNKLPSDLKNRKSYNVLNT